MATGNLQFKVEHGLVVQGTANVSGDLQVGGNLVITGNVQSSGQASGDYIPSSNTLNLGNTTNRWNLFAANGSFSSTVTMDGTLSGNNASFVNVVPTANGRPLGTTLLRWELFANTITSVSANITGVTSTANLAVNTYALIGNLAVNTTAIVATGMSLTINTGSKTSILATGNSTSSNLVLTNDITTVAGNVTFDTDLLFIDAVNNRVGFKNTTPSSAAVVTVTGNVEFSATNNGLRFVTSNATHNSAIYVVASNTSNSRLTFSSYDTSNSTLKNGGFQFIGVANDTSSQVLLAISNGEIKYKTFDITHSGNFGIYDVNGTRVGP